MIKKLVNISILLIFTVSFSVSALAINRLPQNIVWGGSYYEVKNQHYSNKYEVHHLISKDAWNCLGLDIEVQHRGMNKYNDFITFPAIFETVFQEEFRYQGWAPSILMKKEDHAQTRSYWNVETMDGRQLRNSDEYRNYEYEMLKEGKVWQLINDECEFIKENFGRECPDYIEATDQVKESYVGVFTCDKKEGYLYIQHPKNQKFRCRYELP